MKLTDIFTSYNDKLTQHRVMKLFGKKIVDVRRFFKIRDKYLLYDIPNHIEGRYIYNAQEGNDLVSNIIKTAKPAMLARFGGTEMNIIQYFYDNKDTQLQIHFPQAIIDEGAYLSGLFDFDNKALIRFSNEVFDYLYDCDVLFAWNCFRSPEYYRSKAGILREYASKNLKITTIVPINDGMFYENSWTKYLKGKKVLVIHPFADTIINQYAKRDKLFENKNILPEFDLSVIKAPQGIGENNLKEQYGSWQNALKSMQQQMDNIDFDICLIGAGAYGYHLAHYAKQIGKIGIHVAGALQLLFGIKGTRWIQYAPFIHGLMNEHWVFPDKLEYPVNNQEYLKGEGNNAYW